MERELALISDVELFQVVGGFSSGNNAGLINHSFEESVDFLTDPGTATNIESEQDLFYGSKIALNETTFNAYLNNYTTSSSDSSGSSSGYGSTGLSSTGYVLDEVIINSTGSNSTGHGYDHFSTGYQNGSGYNYSTGNGSTGSGSAGGDWGPGNGGIIIPADPDISNDPWERDINGEVIEYLLDPTDPRKFNTSIDYTGSIEDKFDKVKLNLIPVIIKGPNNLDVLAYKVTSYFDAQNIEHFDIPERYKANCHGSATGLNLWIHDPFVPIPNNPNLIDSSHEDQSFRDMMNNNYTSNQTDATIISFYNNGVFSHSVRRDPATGKIWSKTDNAEMQTFNSLEDFYATDGNRTKYEDNVKQYYKF